MCGVFGFSVGMSSREFADRLGIDNLPRTWKDFQSYKITPRSVVNTVSQNSPNQLVPRIWWLAPPWANDPYKIKFPTFNARVEDLANKPAFRHAWHASQRCLIPATFFVEWETQTRVGESKPLKLPYLIERHDHQLFCFAGLYEIWQRDAECKTVESCTIITVPAGNMLSRIHTREPVILAPDDEKTWLSKSTSLSHAYALLKPLSENQKSMHQINARFNSTKALDITPNFLTPSD